MKINRKFGTVVALLLSVAGIITCAIDHEYLAVALWLVLGVGNDLLIYKLEDEIETLTDSLIYKNEVIKEMSEELSDLKGEK